MSRWLCLAAVVVTMVSVSGGVGRGQSREDEAAVRAVVAAMTEAFNEHDAKAVAALYTSDADFVSVRGLKWHGATEIERGLKTLFETTLRQAKLTPREVSVRFVKADVAVVHVRNELSGRIPADGKVAPPHEELSVRVMAKENGQWRVTVFHNTIVEGR